MSFYRIMVSILIFASMAASPVEAQRKIPYRKKESPYFKKSSAYVLRQDEGGVGKALGNMGNGLKTVFIDWPKTLAGKASPSK